MNCGPRNGLQDQMRKRIVGTHYVTTENRCKPPPPINTCNKAVLPEMLLCFQTTKPQVKPVDKTPKIPPKRTKSRELIGSILHVGCECERRNGLQDQCPRSECRGAPECMLQPPTCGPSEFSQNKHWMKHYEDSQRARREFIRKWNEEQEAKQQKPENTSYQNCYECIPVEQIINAGSPCPICDRSSNRCYAKDYGEPKPIIIELPVEYCCSPEAC